MEPFVEGLEFPAPCAKLTLTLKSGDSPKFSFCGDDDRAYVESYAEVSI